MYRFLLSRRWATITLIALLLIPAMVELGFWQLHRHQARVARNDAIAAGLAARPAPLEELTAPGRAVADGSVWRTVTARGRYDAGGEFVVRRRTGGSSGDEIGYYVVTPFRTDTGATALVNRGWVPSGSDAIAYPSVPPAPRGEVALTGRLRADETTARSGIRNRGGLPDRQYMLIDGTAQSARLGTPLLGGYVELTATDPAPAEAPLAVAEPDHDSIGAHLAYAIQWWLFAALVPVGCVVLARREAASGADGPPPQVHEPLTA